MSNKASDKRYKITLTEKQLALVGTAVEGMMNDLISRQAAIEAFDGVKVDEENCTEYDIGYNDGIDFAVSRLSVLPPAQPEIIRCKDCKHWRFDHTCREHSLVSPMMANEFCSRAERREG